MTLDIRTQFDVPATMRDGTVLRANVFSPEGEGPYPVALTRTPYGKDFGTSSTTLDVLRLAREGYIVVIQDVRGRFASEGEWRVFEHEREDGYDTVEWAAGLPGSNGKVGMFGASYLGFTQWMAAVANPPHLKALVPVVTWADLRDGVFWRGGALELGLMAFWQVAVMGFDILARRFSHLGPAEQYGAMRGLVEEIDNLRTRGYWSLPLKEFEPMKRVGIAPDLLQEMVRDPNGRATAALYSVCEWYDQVRVPALQIGGWYDVFAQGTIQNWSALRERGSTVEARQTRLVMGPWAHSESGHVVGQVDFGMAADMAFMNLQSDVTGLTKRWFDYWLKGIDNGAASEAPLKLFVMGENRWRDEAEWPLARTVYTPFYLHSAGRANTLEGDGRLSEQAPGEELADEYSYDPANPTLTEGGAILMSRLYTPGIKDQRQVEARADVLVYDSEPLAEDLEVTGPVEVKLWAASDAPDTDWVARLVEVELDGRALNITDGILRARYRNGRDLPAGLLAPGEPYEFTIDLWSTARVIRAGHRLRVDIGSASFPRWDRNLNTGEPFGEGREMRPARQRVLHDAEHPSRIILPVIPNKSHTPRLI